MKSKTKTSSANGTGKAIDSRPELEAQDELTIQLYIKTLEGITIPIKCKPNTDTIADLKREIFLKEGIPIQDQILIYSAKTLEDNQLIKNYGINGSIHLVQKLKQHQQTETPKQDELTLQVFVQTLEGITIPILYKPYTDTIADLKSEIFRKKGIPIEEQMLISANKVLIDSELIIDYGVNEEIHLVQKLKQHQQTETPTQEVIQEAEKNIATLRGLIAQWKSKTEDLTIRNEPEAYKAANAVYTALNDRSEAYFAKPTKENFIALKTAFENSLDENKNNNRKTLETHRGVKELLGNIVLAIIGVGVLYLIAAVANKAINGRFTFFKTESEELIEKTEKGLKNQNGPSA
ncbi:ubiquitin-like protein [Legionella quateirensis]|uniref:Serine/threonine-protein kinase n=1 Tax=Legionella quateirensis TaxID=45072 RepID=A0ABR5RLP7_9GAMM|nr:ubiquitin-like protein [Legionella quateirensis]KTD48136.1 serine/threonine-protein kinase [Legionella quateirensis]